ncbi:MAG: YiiX/YebB-like N1pC/P60 family cysteine hydrolase [Bacteriovoracaceae bacterium]|nr:YiiX/YebB-like N1pC/P60 family cysteine hydrolase [Bacteriovoracaceae bacterium]
MILKIKRNFFLFLIAALSFHSEATNLKTGDLIFVSLPCYMCRLIELEERSLYSHMGMVVMRVGEDKRFHEALILESWGEVKLTPLDEFLKRRNKQVPVLFLRSKVKLSSHQLKNALPTWNGLPYDEKFSWNNTDKNGNELLYCSELIYKFLDSILKPADKKWFLPPLKKMHFQIYPDKWAKYFFPAPVPEGEEGISPQDFVNHSMGWKKLD